VGRGGEAATYSVQGVTAWLEHGAVGEVLGALVATYSVHPRVHSEPEEHGPRLAVRAAPALLDA